MPTVTASASVPVATLTQIGTVSISAQSFAGNKKFQDRISVGVETASVDAICLLAGPIDWTTPALRIGQANAPTARYWDQHLSSNIFNSNIALQYVSYNGSEHHSFFIRDNGQIGTGDWENLVADLNNLNTFNVITGTLTNSSYQGITVLDNNTARMLIGTTTNTVPSNLVNAGNAVQILGHNAFCQDLALAARGTGNESTINFYTSPAGSGLLHQMKLDPRGNLCLFPSGLDAGNSAQRNFVLGSGAAPINSVPDTVAIWGQDQTAGNCCIFMRTENGDILKLYRESAIAYPTGGGTVDTEARLAVSGVIQALKNMGKLA